jgi:DNA polymerase-3 subunit delta'
MLPWQAEVLQHALVLQQQQHLPHAVLLDTPSELRIEGLAHYLASLLLCDQRNELQLCGTCDACRMMSAGAYADFSRVTLEPDEKSKKISKNIKIEQIRKLIHELSLTRKFDRLKIAVIYPADTMNKSSANALLKTLEEPAPHVLLILVTRNPGRIPITLRSRCQLWSIHQPAREQALLWLQSQGLDADVATEHLQFAGGDPLLAQYLQQQGFAQLVDSFKPRLGAFLQGRLSSSELSKGLLASENTLVRRLLEMALNAYCYQANGIDISGSPTNTGSDPSKARQLLDLRARAQRQLLVEENNLDFQIQLEDVLISLKQILTRRSN